MELGECAVRNREATDSERSNKEPATPARPKGALALIGAWREVNEQELESMIEEIYAHRQQELGRPVELDARYALASMATSPPRPGSLRPPRGPRSKAAQRPVPHPLAQDIDGPWAHLPQAVHGDNLTVCDYPPAAVYVDGNDLPVVVGFDLPADVPLVQLLTKAGGLLPRTTRTRHDSLSLRLPGGSCISHRLHFLKHTPTTKILLFRGICQQWNYFTHNEPGQGAQAAVRPKGKVDGTVFEMWLGRALSLPRPLAPTSMAR